MTREEATAYIKEWLKDEYLDGKDRVALTTIIEESEQEPKYCDRNICIQNEYNGIGCGECEVTKSGELCTDAVSRQAAIVQLSHNKTGDDDCDMIIQKDIETIKALPPVTTHGELSSCESCMNGNQEEKAKLCQKSYLAGMEHSRQEPCENCISRQAVLEYINRIFNQGTGKKKSFEFIQKYVEKLPSVNSPQPQTGHWIRMKAYEKWLCSECNTVFRFTFKEHGYCPNCGAKMQEVES